MFGIKFIKKTEWARINFEVNNLHVFSSVATQSIESALQSIEDLCETLRLLTLADDKEIEKIDLTKRKLKLYRHNLKNYREMLLSQRY